MAKPNCNQALDLTTSSLSTSQMIYLVSWFFCSVGPDTSWKGMGDGAASWGEEGDNVMIQIEKR